MTLKNRRQQRAVGQGLFHTAELDAEDGRKLRYIYDCGAMQKYAQQRDERIDEHRKSVGSNEVLDVLFISHIHFDHISGPERLLDKEKGGKGGYHRDAADQRRRPPVCVCPSRQ